MPVPDVILHTARPDEVPAAEWRALDALLAPDEQDCLHRLRRAPDRHAYALAHALRRAAVATVLDARPQDVNFSHDANGAPFVQGAPQLGVSIAHDPALVACAIAPGLHVGVDVETVNESGADMALLVPFVALEQTAGLSFHACWTVLEACWKARGTGLADTNPRIGFRTGPHGRIAVVHADSGHDLGSALVLRPFDDCILAIAVAGPARDFTISHSHSNGAMGINQLVNEKQGRGALSRA